VDIVEVVSQYLSLKKMGENYATLCPFHKERTPSFYVSPKKQIFHCFGCGVGGNVFTFLQKIEGVSFGEAVKKLASLAKIPIPKKEGEQTREQLLRVNEEACKIYQSILKGSEDALSYLKERGVSKESVERFRIGYAPKEGICRGLLKRFDKKLLQQVGLLSETLSERFLHRLIFPIMDITGGIIGFGARALDKREPKYINSPQTPIFNKGNVLYALHFCKEKIKESGYAIIVEGYFDTILLVQEGVENVCAIMGTSLTKEQLRILHRYTECVMMFLDPDEAGKRAMRRGADLAMQEGMYVKVAPLKDADPADLALREGAEGVWRRLKEGRELLQHCFTTLLSDYKEGRKEKEEVVQELLPIIKNVQNPIKRREWLKKIAHAFDVDEKILFEGVRDEGLLMQHLHVHRKSVQNIEAKVLSYIIKREDKEMMKVLNPEDFEDTLYRSIYEAMLCEGFDMAALVDKLGEEAKNALTLLCMQQEEEGVQDWLRKLQERSLRRRYKNLQKKIGEEEEKEVAKVLYEIAKRRDSLIRH
jgi:DNA primase